jgi:ATP-dependent Zn protease
MLFQITVKPPRAKGRLEILKVHAKRVNLSPEVDLWTVAKNLQGFLALASSIL